MGCADFGTPLFYATTLTSKQLCDEFCHSHTSNKILVLISLGFRILPNEENPKEALDFRQETVYENDFQKGVVLLAIGNKKHNCHNLTYDNIYLCYTAEYASHCAITV